MLTSISPLGERARGHRWWLTTTSYVVGSTCGGMLLGLLLGTVGAGVDVPAWLGGVVLLVCAGLEIGGQLPHGRRQVDRTWLDRYRGGVYGFGYGAQLGVGVVTIVTSASTYAVWGLALTAGSAPSGGLLGATFGLVRALPLLAMVRAGDPTAVRRAARRLSLVGPSLRPCTAVALLLAGAGLLAAS